MVFTDPPYNVNYANSAKDKMRGKDRAILNDNLGDGFYDFLLAALTPTVAHCRGGIYVAMSSSELDVLQAAFRAAGGKWSTFIIWAKNTFTLGRADYQRQYEPILYGWPRARNATGVATAIRATSGTSRSRRRTTCTRR
jgi:DNA modification methylase